ncbi:hypothetical protein HK096_000948 [Nowakowskiella sp. JEL0078]|nr:hypothetical protein HK096_000948 [Nowakowskiella sp. JEL0078]
MTNNEKSEQSKTTFPFTFKFPFGFMKSIASNVRGRLKKWKSGIVGESNSLQETGEWKRDTGTSIQLKRSCEIDDRNEVELNSDNIKRQKLENAQVLASVEMDIESPSFNSQMERTTAQFSQIGLETPHAQQIGSEHLGNEKVLVVTETNTSVFAISKPSLESLIDNRDEIKNNSLLNSVSNKEESIKKDYKLPIPNFFDSENKSSISKIEEMDLDLGDLSDDMDDNMPSKQDIRDRIQRRSNIFSSSPPSEYSSYGDNFDVDEILDESMRIKKAKNAEPKRSSVKSWSSEATSLKRIHHELTSNLRVDLLNNDFQNIVNSNLILACFNNSVRKTTSINAFLKFNNVVTDVLARISKEKTNKEDAKKLKNFYSKVIDGHVLGTLVMDP